MCMDVLGSFLCRSGTLWDVLGCFGKFCDVLGCFFMFWDVLGQLDILGRFLDVLGHL